MRKIIIYVYLMAAFSALMGQKYQAFYSDRTMSFHNIYEGYKFQKIVSTETFVNDSVFVFFSSFDWSNYECISADGPHWLGRKIIIKENGDNIFFNSNNDSIIIKAGAEINTPWVAFHKPDSIRVEAEVIKHDTLTFLGLVDSVKTIEFRVFDKNNINIAHVLNAMQIRLSKNHGMVKTLLFRDFPHFENLNPAAVEFEISGISNPQVGVQNMTWKEVFDDFYPGDELHIIQSSCNGFIDARCTHTEIIYKYQTREEYTDSIKYTLLSTISTRSTYNRIIIDYKYMQNTMTSMVHFNPGGSFHRFSEESFYEGESVTYNLQSLILLGDGISVMTKSVGNFDYLVKADDDCWAMPVLDVMQPVYYYYKGLGGPYYYASIWSDYDLKRLVYYKKGDVQWGTPLTLVDETPVESTSFPAVTIYPNPATDFVWVQSDVFPLIFEIVNTNGRVVKTESIESNSQQIDTSMMFPGIYLYRLRSKETVLKTGKILITG